MAKSAKPSLKQAERSSLFSSLSPTTIDVLCIVGIYIVTLILFRDVIFENAAFASSGDTAAATSYAHAGNTIHQKEGVDVLWMPNFFSGMPTFGNVSYIPRTIAYVQSVLERTLNLLYLNGKWTWYCVYYFLGGVFMFLLMRVWKFSRVAALLAALTFMLNPFAIGLAGEGHGSKLMTLSYLPLVFLLTHMVFERRDLLSFGLLAAAVGTQLLGNHMQIVYYTFMLLGGYLLYHIILDFPRDKMLAARKTALFAGALLLGLCISAYIYLSVYEFSQYSMRGGGTEGSTGGLAYDYATNWSWSPWEVITLFIPAFYGMQMPFYWGHVEPWTNSTAYFGIVPMFLAILAIGYKRTRLAWFAAVVTLIIVLISFGRNLPLLYDLLFAVLPFFNKFRAPSMLLHLLPFSVGILAAIGYEFLVATRERTKEPTAARLGRTLIYVAGALGALLILALMLKGTIQQSLMATWFIREGEPAELKQQYGQQAPQAIAYLTQARFDLFWKDLIKFFIIASVVAGLTAAFLSRKMQAGLLGGALILVLVVDLFIIDGKYIDPKPATAIEQSFQPDATTSYLLQQPGLFRIFPWGPLFSENAYAYHGLQSIGGYSPAKLKIYQTILDSCLYRGVDPSFPLNMGIVNMLNVQYIIAQARFPEDRFERVFSDATRRLLTYRNPAALPRAFFVEGAQVAGSEHEVFAALNAPDFDPRRTAILQKAPGVAVTRPDSAHVEILNYQSRSILISASTSSPALLVLSEVYYPAGWKAFVDDVETEILRTNYIIRSVVVPAGTHKVVFSFDPPLYRAGWIISNSAWGVAGICVLLGLWRLPWIRRRLRKNAPPSVGNPST